MEKGRERVRRLIRIIAVGVGVGLLLASSALAQDPTVRAYGGLGGEVGGTLDQTSTAQTLPFTGLDVALVFGAGLILLALGIVLRKTARNRA